MTGNVHNTVANLVHYISIRHFRSVKIWQSYCKKLQGVSFYPDTVYIVVHTYVLLSPSSITWYWAKGGNVLHRLWLGR